MMSRILKRFNQTHDSLPDHRYPFNRRRIESCQFSQKDQMRFILLLLLAGEQKVGEELWRELYWIWVRLLAVPKVHLSDPFMLICLRAEGEFEKVFSYFIFYNMLAINFYGLFFEFRIKLTLLDLP
jgi:hypothetical protein